MHSAKQVLTAAMLMSSLAACGPAPEPSATSTAPPASAGATHAIDVPGGFSTVVPVAWHQASFDTQAISHSTVLAYLSTEPISHPCNRIPAASATTGCPDYPVDRLQPDGVLVTWTAYGLGGEQVDWTAGEAITVGGESGRLLTQAPGEACSAIIGEREMIVRLRSAGAQAPDYTEIDACYLGPDTDKTEAQLRAMLSSVTWH